MPKPLIVKLGAVAALNMGQSPSSTHVSSDGEGIPFLQGNAEFGDTYPSAKLKCSYPKKLCRAGDVLISVRAPVGAVNKANQEYCIGRGLAAITFNRIRPNFGWHAIRFWSQSLSRVSQGSTFEAISGQNLADLELMIFDDKEQQQIAEVLDTLDEAVYSTRKLIDKLERTKEGLLHDLLTKGLDESGNVRDIERRPEAFKETLLGRVPREWEVKTVGEVAESLIDGPFGSNLKTNHYVQEPGVRVVRLQNIDQGTYNDSDKAFISEPHSKRLQRHTVMGGDLLVAALGDDNHLIARSCLYPLGLPSAINKADCFRVRVSPREGINAYLMHVLNNPSTRKDISTFAQGVTRDRINLTTFQQIRLRLPPIREQIAICKALELQQQNSLKEATLLRKLEVSKSGVAYDLLTGQIQVGKVAKRLEELL